MELMRETDDGYVKGSLRTSDDSVDVSKIANLLGGGGHHKASGFKIKGSLVKKNNHWVIKKT